MSFTSLKESMSEYVTFSFYLTLDPEVPKARWRFGTVAGGLPQA